MKLIAKQPCSFGGKRFYIGEEIPVELVLEPKTQEKYGKLVIVDDEASLAVADTVILPGGPDEANIEVLAFPVVIHTKDGDVTLALEPESIQTVVDVLTANADEAEKLVKQINSDDILFLLNAADSRKTVQTAAKARAQALMEAQEGEESAGEQ